jgi:hypothetical protein
MGTLFDRAYTVTVSLPGGLLAVQITGLRCVFSVKKTIKSQANTVDLKIYNLSDVKAQAIQSLPQATVQIDAGYVDQTSTLFLGDVRTHVVNRDGRDLVTHMGAGDGEKAIQHARISQSFRKGSSVQQVLTALAASLGVDPGNVPQAAAKLAPYGSMFTMGTVLHGSAARELTRILHSVGYDWSIQNGKLQILSIKDVLLGTAVLLTPFTGLLDSPSIDKDGLMNCKALMQPDVFPGRLLVLTSESLQGQYRVEETTHSGDTHSKDTWHVEIKARPY